MRIAVVGTGKIAGEVAPHLSEWGFEVAAVVGTPRSADKVAALAAQLGGKPYISLDDLLAQTTPEEVPCVYVAVPNFLHHDLARQALLAGRNVICEKPLCSNEDEAQDLATLARERRLFLFEAITTLYLPNYLRVRSLLPRLGAIKLVSANYSQYSSRYDAFRAGTVLPVFDPAKSGGALMDLGLYCLMWVCGLFGEPQAVTYAANVERGIDTSGMALLDYGSFKAVAIAAKDCGAPSYAIVQGTEGYVVQSTPPNVCGPVELHLNDGTVERYDDSPAVRFESEFRSFAADMAAGEAGLAHCYQVLGTSLTVARVQTKARLSAGVRFPADEG